MTWTSKISKAVTYELKAACSTVKIQNEYKPPSDFKMNPPGNKKRHLFYVPRPDKWRISGSIYQESFRRCPEARSDILPSIAPCDLKSKAWVFLKWQCSNATLSGRQALSCINHQWSRCPPHFILCCTRAFSDVAHQCYTTHCRDEGQ